MQVAGLGAHPVVMMLFVNSAPSGLLDCMAPVSGGMLLGCLRAGTWAWVLPLPLLLLVGFRLLGTLPSATRLPASEPFPGDASFPAAELTPRLALISGARDSGHRHMSPIPLISSR
jgi:hypothetical protein